jgi:hypothetical protein
MGSEVPQVAHQLSPVVPLDREALQRVQPRELVAIEIPVPLQGPMDVTVSLGAVGCVPIAIIRCHDAGPVPRVACVPHGRLPHELKAAGVVWRVHVADREDPQPGRIAHPS